MFQNATQISLTGGWICLCFLRARRMINSWSLLNLPRNCTLTQTSLDRSEQDAANPTKLHGGFEGWEGAKGGKKGVKEEFLF